MEKVFCVGLGKLGLIFAHILANDGNKVFGFDNNFKIADDIKMKKNLYYILLLMHMMNIYLKTLF